MSLLDSVEGLVVPAWGRALLRAAPLIMLGLLIGALAIEHRAVTTVTAERDRIIRVVDPTGKASPDQAIAIAQGAISQRDAAKSALTVTTANYRRATASAQAADLTHARAVEQHDAAISGKVQHDLEAQLASARADADRHAGSLRAPDTAPAAPGTDRGGSGVSGLPGAAYAASGAPGAHTAAELDDTRACAVGVTLAEGWQRWWREVAAAPR